MISIQLETVESIIDRLPENLQNQWIKRSNKILNTGSEPTFNDLTLFVEERADDYNSKYGQYIAEKRSAATSKIKQHEHVSKPKEIKRLTTLATSATGGDASTAGLDAESTCTSTSTSLDAKKQCAYCEKIGYYIATCHHFKKLSIQEKREAVRKKNLCFRCLRAGYGSSDCDKLCSVCSKKHHYHLHEEHSEKPTKDGKTLAASIVSSTTCMERSRATIGIFRVCVQHEESEMLCWALLDTGSNTTFIKRSVADALDLTGPDHNFSLTTVAGTSIYDEMIVNFKLVSEDGENSVDVHGALTIPSVQVRAKYDGKSHKKYKHLEDLDFPAVDTEVDIVIGADCPEMFWCFDERHGGPKEAIARKTRLGWILLGPT